MGGLWKEELKRKKGRGTSEGQKGMLIVRQRGMVHAWKVKRTVCRCFCLLLYNGVVLMTMFIPKKDLYSPAYLR